MRIRWPRPNRDRFARRVIRALRACGLEGDIEPDLAAFELRQGADQWINLANIYAECCQLPPWRRGAAIRRFARSVTVDKPMVAATFEEARPRLLPGIRHIGVVDWVELSSRLEGRNEPDGSLAWAPFTPHLVVCLYLDAEEGMMAVGGNLLRQWGVGFDEALAVARDNLAERSAAPLRRVADGLYDSTWADCYDAARLLLPELLRPLELEGAPVAVCPHWRWLIVTGERSHGGLATALQAALDSMAGPKPVSGLPIVYRYPRWEPLAIPRGHPCHELWRRVRVHELVGPYEEQKKQLERLYERDGVDIFVATFGGFESSETKAAHSYCVWTKGVLSLLPETDVIAFVDSERAEGERVLAEIDWDVATAYCGPLMTRTEHRLPRHRVDQFPTAEQLELMKAAQGLRSPPRPA